LSVGFRNVSSTTPGIPGDLGNVLPLGIPSVQMGQPMPRQQAPLPGLGNSGPAMPAANNAEMWDATPQQAELEAQRAMEVEAERAREVEMVERRAREQAEVERAKELELERMERVRLEEERERLAVERRQLEELRRQQEQVCVLLTFDLFSTAQLTAEPSTAHC